MKLIFLMFFTIVNIFANNKYTDEDMIWRKKLAQITYHGLKDEEWTKKIIHDKNCKVSEENKFSEIKTISLNNLNKKPEDWLVGKYLQFVNENCKLSIGLRTSKEEFENIVNLYFKNKEANSGNKETQDKKNSGVKIKDIPLYIILFILGILPIVIYLFIFKAVFSRFRRGWFFYWQ